MRRFGAKKRAISREVFSLVERNYPSIEDVDTAIKASLGIRLPVVGIFQTHDLGKFATNT